MGSDWAHFSAKARGAKVHVIYDADAEQPVYAVGDGGPKINDITAAKDHAHRGRRHLRLRPRLLRLRLVGGELDAAGCRIVTRFRSSTPLDGDRRTRPARRRRRATSCPTASACCRAARPKTARTRSPSRSARCRIKTDTGKVLRLLSNDLDAPAREIADLYKRRWAIELFFRWIKQNLKIKHFIGHQRERRAHPDRRRPDRLSAPQPRQGRTENRRIPARLRPPRARQPHAPKAHRLPHRTPYPPPKCNKQTAIQWPQNLNRTAVEQVRA